MPTAQEIAESGATGEDVAKRATEALNGLTATRVPALSGIGRDLDDDLINHPAHYGGGDNPYEAIKVIEAWDLGFSLGNAVKYVCRAGKKPGTDQLQDLEKAAFYLNREIERLRDEAPR